MSIFCGAIYAIWVRNNYQDHTYLSLGEDNIFKIFIIKSLNWVQLFSNLIPISLIVTVETVKFIQSKLAMNDEFMVSDSDVPLMVNSSNLNEELGQIEYIFTDKTGTLTQNKMVFKNLIVDGVLYPKEHCGVFIAQEHYENVNFDDGDFVEGLLNSSQNLEVVNLLAICHNISIENG